MDENWQAIGEVANRMAERLRPQFKAGDRVHYRAFAGDIFDAVVTGVRLSGFLDLDIELPGNREPFHTTAVPAERCRLRTAEPPQGASDARP